MARTDVSIGPTPRRVDVVDYTWVGTPHGGIGWMAERSKALVSGTSLFGGVGSNPTPVTPLFVALVRPFC